ncbi:MAG: insulinase family protein [Chthoniobacterales bacterium]|nr:insulinase family protein [Chthoniobacterales bacterium]
MKTPFILAALLCATALTCAQEPSTPPASPGKLLPYEYYIDDLPNDLRLVTIPTDYPNLVAFYLVVATGSRNEVEPGKSGYAHFFEHMMFRGSENYPPGKRDEILQRAGAQTNAYTTDDRTVYHQTFSKEDLPEVMAMEADRFQRLKYEEPEYKTEALAVLGEYNKNSAAPTLKLFETLRANAYTTHTYKHTTMGFIQDIEDMPNQFDYSWEFFRRYYRPEYTTILVVGDVKRDEVLDLVKKNFGTWERGDYKPEIPTEPEQTAPKTAHVDWPTPTLPYVVVAFHAPAFSETEKDKAALDLVSEIAFGENSELYQRLVIKEQKVDTLAASYPERMDPTLFTVIAKVKEQKDMDYVRDQVLATFDRFTKEAIPQQKLDDTRSRLRYGTALSLDSSEAIAGTLASYLALRRTPEAMEQLFAMYDTVTPEDARVISAKYFVEPKRTIVTLATKADAGKKPEAGQ